MSTVPILSKAQTRVHIRWMIRRDMPEVLAIEHSSFEHPLDRGRIPPGLATAELHRHGRGASASSVVGFMIYELHKNKLNVLDFAVHPEFKRQGIGQQMVDKLVGKLSSHRRTRIVLHVRETNLPAQHFFRVQGFLALEVVREHYGDTGEDAYLMHYLFDESVVDEPMPVNRIAKQLGN